MSALCCAPAEWCGVRVRGSAPSGARPGDYTHVKDLNAKIHAFIPGWNDRPAPPFVWSKTADQTLKKADRKATSYTRTTRGRAIPFFQRIND